MRSRRRRRCWTGLGSELATEWRCPFPTTSTSWWRSWARGAVFVGVHTVLAPPEKRYLIDDCQPSLYLTTDFSEGAGAPQVIGLDHWRSRVTSADPLDPFPEVDPLAVAAIAYTSGTTGNPKGVMHSQHNALLPGAVAVARGSYDADDIFLCVQPPTILNLQVLNPLTTIQAHATCVIADRHDPVSLARWIKQEGVTHFAVVPTVAYDLLTHPDVHPHDLATLTKPRVGGAGMPEPVKLLFEERFGAKPATSYALTEGPTLVARQDLDRPIVEGVAGGPCPTSRCRCSTTMTGPCRLNLASFKVPSEVWFVEAFPRSPLGKIARSQVMAMAKG